MTQPMIHPVVLSGGMGTRLWPMSRVRQPKQFQPIDGNGGPSFLQDTVLRHSTSMYHAPTLVAAGREKELIDEQMSEIGITARFIGEPMGRDTGPAVLSAALTLAEDNPEALLLVLPSDHRIKGDLNAAIEAARPMAEAGHIVLFGIPPRYPETGFGYITGGDALDETGTVHKVAKFVEKPDEDTARSLIEGGRTFWASGISLMRADVLVEEFDRHKPDTLKAVRGALRDGEALDGGQIMAASSFAQAEKQPTERLIFERSDRVAVAPADVDWSDVGAWTAVHSIGEKSNQGNVESGEVMALDTRNSLIRAGEKLVTVIGMEDVIVVDTPDALLVTNHSNAQRVKEAVEQMRKMDRSEVLSHPGDGAGAGAVNRHTVPKGAWIEIAGGDPGGAILVISAGEATIVDGPLSGHEDQGAHLEIQPGQVVAVGNHGDSPLDIVTIDISPGNATRPTTVTMGSDRASA